MMCLFLMTPRIPN